MRLDLPRAAVPALFRVVHEALPSIPPTILGDMVQAGTVGENLAALAAQQPDVLDPKRWQGLLCSVPREMRGKSVLNIIDTIETSANG
jgi:hypothetical protein